jgi:PEP-CTERM motif
MPRTSLAKLCRVVPLTVFLTWAMPVGASVIPLTPADFSGASLITFTGLPNGTIINGMTINGVLFNYLVNNVASIDARIGSGPGNTNNITSPDVENFGGNANAVLRLTFPAAEVRLGYGYAILSTLVVPNATTVSLFDASNVLVGALSATGSPDPIFTGGFLGLQSTIPFVRADLTFSTTGALFAVDNVRFSPTPVPEPSTLTLLAFGLATGSRRLLRRRSML